MEREWKTRSGAVECGSSSVRSWIPAKMTTYSLVLGLGVLFTLQDFLLSLLQSPRIYFFIAAGLEAIVYGVWIWVIRSSAVVYRTIRDRVLQCFLFTCLVIGILSISFSPGEFLPSILKMKALVRFIFVASIIAQLHFQEKFRELFTKAVYGLAIISSVLSFSQWLSPAIRELTTVQKYVFDEESIAMVQSAAGADSGAVFAFFDTAAEMALFMSVAILLLVSEIASSNRRLGGRTAICLAVFFFALILTFKRGALLCTIVALLIIFLGGKRRYHISIILVGFAFTLLLLSPIKDVQWEYIPGSVTKQEDIGFIANLESAMTAEYWEHNFLSSRGWVIIEVLPRAIWGAGILGYGPDRSAACQAFINDYPELGRLYHYRAFEDVYWVGLTVFFGFPFVLLFLVFIAYIWYTAGRLKCRTTADWTWVLFIKGLIVYVFLVCFIYQALNFRVFSFWFWMAIGIFFAWKISLKRAVVR